MKKKIRNRLLVLVLLLAVGFAAVSTTLIINGTAVFGTNTDDFDVIFTKSVIDGVDVSESSISEDGQSLTFTTSELAIMNDTSVLEFVVTNNSTQYDAAVTMECVAEGEHANTYYKVESDLPEVISAASKENGNVTVTLLKTSVDEIEETFTCTISATATERTEVGKAKLEWVYTDLDADGKISEGDLYALGNEKFNVISNDGTNIKLFAQYNLGNDYKQTTVANKLSFSSVTGWSLNEDIDIQLYDGNVKNYVNEYVSYLNSLTGSEEISGTLITITELVTLGCTGPTTSNGGTKYYSCDNSSFKSWILNGQTWWTRTASDYNSNQVWNFKSDNYVWNYINDNGYGIRPVITISKDTLNNL